MGIAARDERAPHAGAPAGAAALQQLALTLRQGARVDRYEIVEVLGVGAFGAVYRARHVHTHQLVALKVLRTEARARAGAWEGLLKEARAAASIGHPNIVRVFDCGLAETGAPFLVMELVEGCDLGKLLRAEGRAFAVPRALELAQQVLAGLSAAHARGIVHRDVKPANIFVTPVLGAGGTTREHVRVLDFGISKVLDADPELQRTLPGMALGTPGYMAPEQFGDARGADARADVYAVGATLFELFTGHTPFGHVDFEVLLAKVRFERPPPLAQVAPHVPLRVAEVIDRALARDPDARWSSAAQFATALRDALAEVTAVGVTGHDASQRTSALALGTAPTSAMPSVGGFGTGPVASSGVVTNNLNAAAASGVGLITSPLAAGAAGSGATPATRQTTTAALSQTHFVAPRQTPPPAPSHSVPPFGPGAYGAVSSPPSAPGVPASHYAPAPHSAPASSASMAPPHATHARATSSAGTIARTTAAAPAPTRVLPLVLAVAGGSLLTLLVVGAFFFGQYQARGGAAGAAAGAAPMMAQQQQQQQPGMVMMPQQPMGYPTAPMAQYPMAPAGGVAPTPSAPVTAPSAPVAAAPTAPAVGGEPAGEPPAVDNEAATNEVLYAIARGNGVTISELHTVGEVNTGAVRNVAARAVTSMGECRVPGRRLTVRVQIFVNSDGTIPIAHPWNSAAGDSGPTPVAQCIADHFREAAPRPWSDGGDGIFDFRADLAPR